MGPSCPGLGSLHPSYLCISQTLWRLQRGSWRNDEHPVLPMKDVQREATHWMCSCLPYKSSRSAEMPVVTGGYLDAGSWGQETKYMWRQSHLLLCMAHSLTLSHHHLYLLLVITIHSSWACQVVLVVKDLPASAGDVRDAALISGLEDPPEEGMATHSSILAWRILWTEEPGRLQSMGSQRVGHDWSNLAHTYHMLFCWN